MRIIIGKYTIQSNPSDWMVKKQKGKQWESVGYYSSLEQAVKNLFTYKVNTETKEFVVDFNDATNIAAQKISLIQKIESLKEEILEALK